MNQPENLHVRREIRRHARSLLRNSRDVSAHMARLHVAMEMPGAEPVQGALADIFTSFGPEQTSFKRAALQMVRSRMAQHVVRWFEAQTEAIQLERITPLATRWSVLAIPSADLSTRARRCSTDDSRVLAAQVVRAVELDDVSAQQAFLHHCLTCHDNLAFMLARRTLLRLSATLPPGWDVVSRQLEQGMVGA